MSLSDEKNGRVVLLCRKFLEENPVILTQLTDFVRSDDVFKSVGLKKEDVQEAVLEVAIAISMKEIYREREAMMRASLKVFYVR